MWTVCRNKRSPLHCRVTTQLWDIFVLNIGLSWQMPVHTLDTISSWKRSGGTRAQRKNWSVIPGCIWWTMCRRRTLQDDCRLFCGDLGNEVNDDVLSKAFSRFPTFNMAKVVRDKRTGKNKGYGFVSFSNPLDLAAALKVMNGKYVGNRPIKLRKSNWRERTDTEALESRKNQSHHKPKTAKKGIFHQ